VLALAGCGSATRLPPPAGPAHASAVVAPGVRAVVDGRARTLSIRSGSTTLASAPAGVGPARVACASARLCYVTDRRGDALLVFAVGDGGRSLHLTRRVYLPGGPDAIAVDTARHRLEVTTDRTHRLALLPAHGRPHVLAWRATRTTTATP
jgi:hypothetical protein